MDEELCLCKGKKSSLKSMHVPVHEKKTKENLINHVHYKQSIKVVLELKDVILKKS